MPVLESQDAQGAYKMYAQQEKKQPRVSVIMSVYEAGTLELDRAISSILNQTLRDFEFLICNDGSEKNKAQLHTFARRDKRIVIVEQDNLGLTPSLNRLIALAQGKYIARQDADDCSFPDRLEKQFQLTESTHSDLCLCQAMTGQRSTNNIRPRASYMKKLSLRQLKYGNPYIHGTYFVRTSWIKNSSYDAQFKVAQDYEWLLRQSKKNIKACLLQEPLYYLKMSDKSISATRYGEQCTFAKKALSLHLGNDHSYIADKTFWVRQWLKLRRSLQS